MLGTELMPIRFKSCITIGSGTLNLGFPGVAVFSEVNLCENRGILQEEGLVGKPWVSDELENRHKDSRDVQDCRDREKLRLGSITELYMAGG